MLAYLALAERPVPRSRLAELIFSSADDPLGALRWTLAELRRALRAPNALEGDPLRLRLPPEAQIDVRLIDEHEIDTDLIRGELIEGAEPAESAAFAAWLMIERRRLAGACSGTLHDAALEALASGNADLAVDYAARGLAFDAYDEDMNELLVRCLAAAGSLAAAREHADACDVLFRRELGRSPDRRIRRAAEPPESADPAAIGSRAAAVGQLDAGSAALAAGATEPGLACLRQGCAEARALGDPAILRRALVTLGVALVHAVRGRDEEGAALLHEARLLAEDHGDWEIAGRACRQLGFVDVQAGRNASASRWLHRASQLADTDDARAAVQGVRGMALSDRAHYPAATQLLRESVALAERCGDRRQTAWSLAILGRAYLLQGETEAAVEATERSLEIVEALGWIAFQPLPEALRAEAALREDDGARAASMLEHAFAVSCRIGDPCWEALAARANGLLARASGERDRAEMHLRDAVNRANRVPDSYAWIHAYCLEALVGNLIAGDRAESAVAPLDSLERVAARGDMRELIVRAAIQRSRLGDPSGLDPARALSAAIDSPLLERELAAAR